MPNERPSPPSIPDHTLLGQIGSGSYGDVWLAKNRLGTLRAVKIVHRSSFEDDRPFQREFKGIQRFEPISRSHEGLVDILQVGGDEGCFYYVMELADDCAGERREERGEGGPGRVDSIAEPTLSALFSLPSAAASGGYAPRTLRSDLRERGRLPVAECVEIGIALASALAHLHKEGLVHRDVKPSNIIFVGGVPKLADIGLVADQSEARSFVGTEGFIPPEGPGKPQADLYSLGKVLYEACTGRDRQDFPSLPDGDDFGAQGDCFLEFNAILLKACNPDPRARYATAAAMLKDLELAEAGGSVREAQARQFRLASLHRIVSPAMVLVAVIAVTAGVVTLLNRSKELGGQPGTAAVPPVVVLGFRASTNADPGADLRSRLTDALITSLQQVDARVPLQRSGWLALSPEEAVTGAVSEFQAPRYLSGCVVQNGAMLQIELEINDGPTARARTVQRFTGSDADLVKLEEQVVRAAFTALDWHVPRERWLAIRTALSNNVAAFRLLQRCYGAVGAGTRADLNEAIASLRQALALDPRYVDGLNQMVGVYRMLNDVHENPHRTIGEMREAARRAAELDPTSAFAWDGLGAVESIYGWDWEAADRYLHRAMELRRVNWSGNYACFLETLGRWDEGMAMWRKFEAADREGVYVKWGLYNNLFERGCWEEALQQAEDGVRLFPKDGQWLAWVGRCHAEMGDLERAEFFVRQAQQKDDSPLLVGLLGNLLARKGDAAGARVELGRLDQLSRHRYVAAAFRAFIHAGLKDRDAAFGCLEQAYQDRSETLVFSQSWPLKYDPIWEPLRSDERYTNLLRRVKLWP